MRGVNVKPECNVDFGDLGDNGERTYNLIGSKFPDSCCNLTQAPPENLFDPTGKQQTCYLKDVSFNGWRQDYRMRLYLGCVGDKLVGAEDCVPSEVQLYVKDDFLDGTYTYPMNKTFGETTWKTDTPDGC